MWKVKCNSLKVQMPHNNQAGIKEESLHTRKESRFLLDTGKVSDLFSDLLLLQNVGRGKAMTILANSLSAGRHFLGC